MEFIKRARERLEANLSGNDLPINEASEQAEEDLSLAVMVKGYVEDCRQTPSRVANEGIWMTNIAYLIGFDSVHFDPMLRQFRPMGTLEYIAKDRVHVNRIMAKCQNRLARLTKRPPKYDVIPNSTEQEDKDAASLGLQIIQHYWHKENINDKRIDAKMWCQQAGIGYMRVFWDKGAGKFIMDESGELHPEGDIGVEVASPFECFPDPQAKRFEEVRKFARCKIRPLEYFQVQYPEKGHLVKEEGCWLLSLSYDQSINYSTNATGTSTDSDKAMKNSAIEMSYYEAPSRKYPRGRHIVVANGVVLKKGPLPASEGEFAPAMIPYVKFDDIRVAGKFTSEAVITHLRPLQDQLNRVLNQRARWMNRLLTGKYIAANGSHIRSDAFNDQSGEIVFYDPVLNAPNGGAPTSLDMPVIPQSAYIEEERLNLAIDDTCGINEVSSGQLPASNMPAIGMQFLSEQDDTRIGVMTESDEHAYARLGQLILRFAQCYVKTERLLKQVGQNREYIVKKWRGDMLRGNDDVTVIRGSTLPGSKTLDRQDILNLYTQGLLGDPQDMRVRDKVLNLLEFGDIAEVWKDLSLDMHQIKTGIELIENGTKPIISELDNHALWILELNRLRKGDKFKSMSEESQVLLLQVIEEHLKFETDLRNPALGAADGQIPEESNVGQNAAEQELGMAEQMDAQNMINGGEVSGMEPEQIPMEQMQ